MNLEQAKQLRKRLLYLEGMIVSNTREYIWKIMIGPKDEGQFQLFRTLVDPSRPMDPRTIIKPYASEELSVYVFCKIEGVIVCQDYLTFLAANELDWMERNIKMPALSALSATSRPKTTLQTRVQSTENKV